MRTPLALILLSLATAPAFAQPNGEPTFGMEFEFAGNGNRIVQFETMPFENYKKIMSKVVEYYGGNPNTIRRVDFMKDTGNLEKFPSGKRPLFRAEWKDPKGRTWLIEPEFVASSGLDGYELVTPPMDDTKELREVLERVRSSGLVREGRRSGVHLTIDGNSLIKANGDARALANLIVMHENMEPMLRRMFNPVRGGGHANYFARSLAVDHEDLLREIDALRPEERTKEKLTELFTARNGREAALHNADPMNPTEWVKLWKYRSMNLAKALPVNAMHTSPRTLVEFRMFDLSDPATHELQAKLYRRMIARAGELAAEGKTVDYKPRAAMPEGENPSIYNTPNDPIEARKEASRMIESLGLDPVEYQPLLEKTVVERSLRTPAEFKGMLESLPEGRIMHNGKAMTYGFELEGRGDGLTRIARPTNATVNAKWDAMNDAERRAYYNEVVGTDHSSVKSHFKLDVNTHKWLSDYWYVEGSGNWEIHSKVLENLKESTNAMRTAKELTGTSAKGFHLHMRDNAPDWAKLEAKGSNYADFVERASNWVYLKRVERLRTDLSLKSWSNARLPVNEIDDISRLSESDRATIRVAEVNRGSGPNGGYIDMEIRGFTKSVDDIETLAKLFSHQFKTHQWGKWGHLDNPMPSENYGNAPKELSFREHFIRYAENVTGKTPSARKLAIIEGLQGTFSSKAGGSNRAYSTGVATPLLNWHNEASLPETARREAKFASEEFLGWLDRYSDRVMAGEFGVDLSLANETALREKLGLTAAEARAVLAETAGTTLTVEKAARAIAVRDGLSASQLEKLDRLTKFDINNASKAELMARLGVTAAEANKIIRHRAAHDVASSWGVARVNANKRAAVLERAGGIDLDATTSTAEKIAEHTGVSLESARNIVAFRDATDIRIDAELEKAGFGAEEISELRALPTSGTGTNLKTATKAELMSELGLTASQADKVIQARSATKFTQWNDVLNKAGLSEAARNKLKAGLANLGQLNSLSASDLVERTGITWNQANKLVGIRDAVDVNNRSALNEVLGNSVANKALVKANGVDLTRASAPELSSAGLESHLAERLVNLRNANLVGRAVANGPYDAERAAEVLLDAEVIEYGEYDRIEELTRKIDLERATASTLQKLGLSKEQAERLVTYRDAKKLSSAASLKAAGLNPESAKAAWDLVKAVDLSRANVETIMKRTGLTRAQVESLKERAKIKIGTATVDKLMATGMTRAKAERLLAFRDKVKAAGGLDYKEVVRKLRLRVRKWVRDSGLSEHLLRSLLPRAEVNITSATPTEGEGFGRTRRVAGPHEASKMSIELVSGVFASVNEAALERLAARRLIAETDAVASNIDKALERVSDLKLEIMETNDIRADRVENRLRVSTGLLNQIHAAGSGMGEAEANAHRTRVLGLILAHEAAHASGHKSEKMADAEGIKIIEGAEGLGRVLGVELPMTKTEIREAVGLFDKPTGSSHIDNTFNRLRSLLRYGRTRDRIERLEAAAEGENVDKLAKWRRADGTVEWKKFSRDRAGQEALGLAHFGLALFLKELAVVTATGDRARIEEFFDGLMTTDFYKEYGLFVVGARVGEVAYVRYAQRYIKPRFVNGILKSNLVLATGLALPAIVRGDFSGKAFAITLGSLGLSSTAVHGASKSIKWLINLKRAKTTGTAARTGLAVSRLARAGAWFYTAAELAVILYVAEDLEHMVNGWIDAKAAKKALAEASATYFAALRDPNATAESVAAAAEAYNVAWTAYRDFLYRPLHEDEGIFAHRIEGLAREAKIADDRNKATIARLEGSKALRANIEGRYGSLEKYAEHLNKKADAELRRKADMFADSYNMARTKHLAEVYEANKRSSGAYLDDVKNRDWLINGATAGAKDDPYANSMIPLYARYGRSRANSAFMDALASPSSNRLETYDDEIAALKASQAAMRARGRDDLADALDEAISLVKDTQTADDRLANGKSPVVDFGDLNSNKGLGEALREGENR